MKKILFLILFLSSIAFSQTTGYLTTGDSIVTYLSVGDVKYLLITLVDSASTADSVAVEVENPINGDWTRISIGEQPNSTEVLYVVPGVSTTGKTYMILAPWVRDFRIRKTDTTALTEKIYYYIQQLKY